MRVHGVGGMWVAFCMFAGGMWVGVHACIFVHVCVCVCVCLCACVGACVRAYTSALTLLQQIWARTGHHRK